MRKIGTLSSAAQAERFHHYLRVQGIQNRVDPEAGVWEVWIFEEEQVPVGRQALDEFTSDPNAKRYAVKPPPPPKPQAPPVRRISRPQGNGQTPVTVTLSVLSVVISLATQFGERPQLLNQLMLTPLGGDLSAIAHGEVWRLFTPMFLHVSPLHLGFDVYMLWMLGGVIERIRGSRSLLLLILVIAPVSHLVQYAVGGGNFGGLSGVVYGLFGFLWMRSMLLPKDGFFMPQIIVIQLVVWAFLGLWGVLGDIANGAHFGGLIAGMVLGAAPRLWRE